MKISSFISRSLLSESVALSLVATLTLVSDPNSVAWAQDGTPAVPATGITIKPTPAKIEVVQEGELRLDGKLVGSVGAGHWQMQAFSWTSPRGVTVDFEELKNKSVKLSKNAFIHVLGSEEPLEVKDVEIGEPVAVIGRNEANGTLLVRELILLKNNKHVITSRTLTISASVSNFIKQGRAAREQGHLANAIKFFEYAVEAGKTAIDPVGEALAWRDLGGSFSDAGQSAKSIDAYNQAIQVARNSPQDQASAYNGLGLAYRQVDNLEKAVTSLEKAVQLSDRSDRLAQILYLQNLVAAYRQVNRSDDAYSALEKLQPLEEAAGQRDEATQSLAMLALQSAKRSRVKSQEYLQKALPRLEQVRNAKVRAAITATLARTLWYLGDRDKAKTQFEAAIQGYEGAGAKEEAESLRSLSSVLMNGAGAEEKPEGVAPDVIAPEEGVAPEDPADEEIDGTLPLPA